MIQVTTTGTARRGPGQTQPTFATDTRRWVLTHDGALTWTLERVSTTLLVGYAALGLAVDPQTGPVWVATQNMGTVVAVHGATRTVPDTLSIGGFQQFVAVDPVAERVFSLGRRREGSMTIFDARQRKPIGGGRLPALQEGYSGITVNPQRREIFVSTGNQLNIIDADTRNSVYQGPVFRTPIRWPSISRRTTCSYQFLKTGPCSCSTHRTIQNVFCGPAVYARFSRTIPRGAVAVEQQLQRVHVTNQADNTVTVPDNPRLVSVEPESGRMYSSLESVNGIL